MKPTATGAIELTLIIPWASIQEALEKEIVEAVKTTEIPGFRKGFAPRNLVEPKLDKTHLLSHSVQHLLPDYYAAAVKKNNLKPILYPQIKLIKGDEGKDWEFSATTCEAPTVTLPANYQAAIKKLKPKSDDAKLTTIVEYLRNEIKVTIPDMLVEEEANHRLGALIENLTKLGMETQKYLESKKITAEDLKAQTAAQARLDLEVEFILNQIRETEKLADRQKTLDFLQSLL